MGKRFKKTVTINKETKDLIERISEKIGITENAVIACSVWSWAESLGTDNLK